MGNIVNNYKFNFFLDIKIKFWRIIGHLNYLFDLIFDCINNGLNLKYNLY